MDENHDATLGTLTNILVTIKTNVHVLQERTSIVKEQMDNIVERQTLILRKFGGKSESNPVEDLIKWKEATMKCLKKLTMAMLIHLITWSKILSRW